MAYTFYFYDLETSGIRPRESRIMQFAGQRTNAALEPIGEPDNILIKLTEDVLPEPDAILLTGITPQKTLQDGITEVEFLRYFHENIATPHTVFLGFNTIRFDDEFMRQLHYRNFYDPYEWQWTDGKSRWDLLDVVRMTRALRPDGVKWPVDKEGKAVNKLELLAKSNKLLHDKAHDAESDVLASIEVAKLIKQKQPKLFDYLFETRAKATVEKIITSGPFVYTSGRYDSQHDKTTVVITLGKNPKQNGSYLVYDLRFNPEDYASLSDDELFEQYNAWGKDVKKLPIKSIALNRCPAIAPLGVLDVPTQQRLSLSIDEVKDNLNKLKKTDLYDRLVRILEQKETKTDSRQEIEYDTVDAMLYSGFFNDSDRLKMAQVRRSKANQLVDLQLDFTDKRLEKLLLLYKGRQFPSVLNDQERITWDTYRQKLLLEGGNASRLAQFSNRLHELSILHAADKNKRYILEELQLYAQSIVPL